MIVSKVHIVMNIQGGEVARLRARDAQAFHVLVERLQQPITGYLYRLVRDYEVALDLAQDTFLQVYKEIGKTSADLALDAWIYRIATNYALQYLNRKRLRQFVRLSFLANMPSDEESRLFQSGIAEGSAFNRSLAVPPIEDITEIRVLIEQALAHLKPKDAVCVQLHYGNGFTYEQIGKIVSISPEAVRKRVARGVEKFRAVYDKGRAESFPSQSVSLKDSVQKEETNGRL